jgi:hypothetical protein
VRCERQTMTIVPIRRDNGPADDSISEFLCPASAYVSVSMSGVRRIKFVPNVVTQPGLKPKPLPYLKNSARRLGHATNVR